MTQDSENFNKQITAYVVLSASLVMPAVIGDSAVVNADPMIANPTNIQAPMCKYAGPPNPAMELAPANIKTPVAPIMRYADPPNPVIYKEATKNAVPASLSTQASKMNLQMNNITPKNVNNFGGIQVAPDRFIFK